MKEERRDGKNPVSQLPPLLLLLILCRLPEFGFEVGNYEKYQTSSRKLLGYTSSVIRPQSNL
jgi:hypothetical protein